MSIVTTADGQVVREDGLISDIDHGELLLAFRKIKPVALLGYPSLFVKATMPNLDINLCSGTLDLLVSFVKGLLPLVQLFRAPCLGDEPIARGRSRSRQLLAIIKDRSKVNNRDGRRVGIMPGIPSANVVFNAALPRVQLNIYDDAGLGKSDSDSLSTFLCPLRSQVVIDHIRVEFGSYVGCAEGSVRLRSLEWFYLEDNRRDRFSLMRCQTYGECGSFSSELQEKVDLSTFPRRSALGLWRFRRLTTSPLFESCSGGSAIDLWLCRITDRTAACLEADVEDGQDSIDDAVPVHVIATARSIRISASPERLFLLTQCLAGPMLRRAIDARSRPSTPSIDVPLSRSFTPERETSRRIDSAPLIRVAVHAYQAMIELHADENGSQQFKVSGLLASVANIQVRAGHLQKTEVKWMTQIVTQLCHICLLESIP